MVEPNGFRVVGDESLHTWAAFDLVRRRIVAGRVEFERTFVNSPGAVGVVAVDEVGRVVLVEQYRPSLDTTLVELPAGMRDVEGEDPLVTARRELLEETGYSAGTWLHLGSCVGSAAVTNSRVEIYAAHELSLGDRIPHGPEEEAMIVHHVALGEALDMVMDGRIVDAKTSIGLLMYARRIGT